MQRTGMYKQMYIHTKTYKDIIWNLSVCNFLRLSFVYVHLCLTHSHTHTLFFFPKTNLYLCIHATTTCKHKAREPAFSYTHIQTSMRPNISAHHSVVQRWLSNTSTRKSQAVHRSRSQPLHRADCDFRANIFGYTCFLHSCFALLCFPFLLQFFLSIFTLSCA